MSAIHQHGNFKLLRLYNFVPPNPQTTPIENQALAFDSQGSRGELQLKWISLGGFTPTEISFNISAQVPKLFTEIEAKFAAIYKAESSNPCRIRGYNSISARDKDFTRPPYLKPSPNHGCVFDCILRISNLGTILFSPIAIYAGEKLYISIENLSLEVLSAKLYYWG